MSSTLTNVLENLIKSFLEEEAILRWTLEQKSGNYLYVPRWEVADVSKRYAAVEERIAWIEKRLEPYWDDFFITEPLLVPDWNKYYSYYNNDSYYFTHPHVWR